MGKPIIEIKDKDSRQAAGIVVYLIIILPVLALVKWMASENSVTEDFFHLFVVADIIVIIICAGIAAVPQIIRKFFEPHKP